VREELDGLISTVATGMVVTVTSAVPVFPSLVAVIVADPTATPVTKPVDETVATAGLFVEYVIGRPLSTLPWASVT